MLSELDHSFSIIGLSETKIKSSSESLDNYSIPGYSFLSQPSISNAGGVGFFVSKKITSSLRTDLSCTKADFECLWIEVECDLHHNIVCGVIYRHPNTNYESFFEYLSNTIGKVNDENKYCVIMGDFNIDLLHTSHSATEEFLNTLETHFFNPHILQPTRITHHSATLIDNIFLNSITHHTISGNIYYDLTDHLPNFLIINKFSTLPKKFKITKRDYPRFNESDFLEDIETVNWNKELADSNDPSVMFDQFYSILSSIVDKHVPSKQLSIKEIKQLSKPWITKGLRVSIEVKNKFYRKYLRNRSWYYHDKFKLYIRNKLNHLIKISKSSYYKKYFAENKFNLKNTWKGIKEIVGYKYGNSNIPSKIITADNVDLTNCKSIANAFNEFFANIGNSLANSVSQSSNSPFEFMQPAITQSFQFTPISINEIEREIFNLNAKKSAGPYSIPTYLLKSISKSISKPLANIYNSSLSKGLVPEKFKLASVIPVFKKGSHLDVNNYRPISLLSIFDRILEKLVFNRLLDFVNKNSILFNKQFGFRPKHSTLQAILSITDKIQCAVEEGAYSCGIFLDLSKAFDTVNHEILLNKLNHYGVRGVAHSWFSSYLNNRRQFVSLGNVKSDESSITCGVPQGSVLGLILFLLYINDFQNSSDILDFHLFADDSNLFYKNKNLQVLEAIINNELHRVNSWLCANKLLLNIEKTKFVIFHPVQKKILYDVRLKIDNKCIDRATEIKYLGIMLDSHLNWKSHVSFVSGKIKRSIGMICKARHYVHLEILINLYYCLIYPYLIYGIVAWGHTYQSTINPLFILQKKTIRLITFSNFDAHTNPIFLR